jgi:toxin FitB
VERTRRSNPAKAQEIEAWIDELAATHEILPMDGTVFREWARLIEGKSDTLYDDAMIAAIARVHQLTVATRNEADFEALKTPYFNPFRS